MKKSLYFLWTILTIAISISSGWAGNLLADEPMADTPSPKYLYKILSVENWEKSQPLQFLILSQDDHNFIHLATEEQLKRIADKYWSHVPQYMVLKIDTAKLQGRLIFESNEPGGNKYYHLYEGGIPLESVAGVSTLYHE